MIKELKYSLVAIFLCAMICITSIFMECEALVFAIAFIPMILWIIHHLEK